MTQQCVHFQLLRSRVDALTHKFVADQVTAETNDPVGFQPDLDRLAAYRLLVHAEIEDFLEAKARDNIEGIATRMAANGVWMRTCPELLAIAIVLEKQIPRSECMEPQKFAVFVGELISGAIEAIRQNNGVKSASFVLLSILAGKTIDEIDSVLSSSLNSYGKSRGDVAHRSVTHSTSLQAPSAEVKTALGLVSHMATYFDVSA